MRIAVSATRPELDAPVDPHLGRCACFLFVDTDSMSTEAVDNTSAALAGGAGIQAARLIASKGATAVLTGSCGPNAHQTLRAAGVAVYINCSGTVAEAVALFKAGKLEAADRPNAASHSGGGR